MNLLPGMSITSAVLGFLVIMAWRIQEGRSAVTIRKIVIPPLGMATGFCMFVVPQFRVPWMWALGAFVIGALILAYPLVRTSRLALVGDTVMMHRSAAFFLFFVLAFGMILRWRMSMYFEYRRITGTLTAS
jgi:membrane protein CcdC involved in cytochrome C biogenesis